MSKRYGGRARAKLMYQCPKCKEYYHRGYVVYNSLDAEQKAKNKAKKRICSNCRPKEQL